MEATDLSTVQGKTHRFMTPSGDYITIREQNGKDDDIISNSGKAQDGSSFNEFLSGIIIKSERLEGKPSPKDILDIPLRDKYTILLQSRIFSLGNIMEFQYNWGDDVIKELKNYEEDLSLFTWDYKLKYPTEGEEGYFDQRIPPYNGSENFFELELSSGKEVKVDFLNGHSEKYLLELDENNQTANSPLLARNIRLKQPEGKYMKVKSFHVFSARDMAEIRSGVNSFDPEITLFSNFEHPTNGMKESLTITAIPDFFFPVLI